MSAGLFLALVTLAFSLVGNLILWGQLNDAEIENDQLRRRNGELESWQLKRGRV